MVIANRWGVLALGMVAAMLTGCGPAQFPAEALTTTARQDSYDADGDGVADFFCLKDAAGRIDRIAYDDTGDGEPERIIHLDAMNPRLVRHLVIVLDGIPFDVVRAAYQAGKLRLFHPPAVVIPPYPVMTDLAMEDVLAYMPCLGFEARYYDRRRGSLVGGSGDYLAGKNEPFVKTIDYRQPALDDGMMYLSPRKAYAKELAQAKKVWDRRDKLEVIVYFVSSAGLGSRLGEAGQLEALAEAQRLAMTVLHETGGLVKVTLLADHGQTNVPCTPAKLDDFLRGKGYRLVDRLRRDNDVALVKFGLVTCAAMNTPDPAGLALALMECEAVTLASYVRGDAVVVRSRDGLAEIRSNDGNTFEYDSRQGDPLKLGNLAAGKVDGRKLLAATSDGKSEYPDALYRLWRAHFALVENPPDVIVSLDDRYFNGSGFFSEMVDMASTHGGLNWRNSATFIMSSAGSISGPLRSEDIPGAMGQLFGRPFPAGR